MSGISRLLRWAPCLYAVSRLVSSSGQAPRSQLLTTQSGAQHPSGPADLLNTLSFPARTVVKHTHLPRPALVPRTILSPPAPEAERNQGTVSRPLSLLRTRRPLKYEGWQWENPYRLPIRMAHKALSVSNAILSQARGVYFGRTLPIELQEAIVLTSKHPVRKSGIFDEANMLLVCKHWKDLYAAHFWKKRWLNLRSPVAQWTSIAERVQALVRNAKVMHNVKLQGVLTDILPTSLGEALQSCPDLAKIAQCDITKIRIGKLDNLNEVLLAQILLYHQDNIRHFDFRAGDTPFFLGRRSLFAGSVLLLPKVRRVTVDISNIDEVQMLEELHGNSAGLVAFFVAELIGRHDRDQERQVELRVLCMPEVEEEARPLITQQHVLLAAQIYDFTRALLERVAGLKLVVSFQGPLKDQVAHNLRVLRLWAREYRISLINA